MLKYLSVSLVCVICLLVLRTGISPAQTGSKPRPGRRYTTLERLNPERLRAVRDDRLRYQNSRKPVTIQMGLTDYRAILHAHADDSPHTGGTRPELLAAAKRTGVKIIMLSDHVRPPRDFINDSWRGMRDGVLFLPGAESEGFLVYPQASIIESYRTKSWKTRENFIELVRQKGGNIFLSHVEERLDWPVDKLDGLEIYNHHTDYKDETEFVIWLRTGLTNSERLTQIEKLLAGFPAEIFGITQDYLEPIIAKWDRDSQKQRLTGIGANDCHHNQVFTVKVAGPQAIAIEIIGDPPRTLTTEQMPRIAEMIKDRKDGEVIAKLDFDPYELSLNYITTHILLPGLNENDVRTALKQGQAYVAHDWLCDPTGFAFIIERQGKRIGVMGAEVKFENGLALRLATPVPGQIKLFRNGQKIEETLSDKLDFTIKESGIYRAEIWLEIDSEQRPWIFSNAIRVITK
ncbi:MAG: histidinol phosphatase [Acidobacteria bacterium]|nr:histidinol phosphatase [Acidobacteriota bacterium]